MHREQLAWLRLLAMSADLVGLALVWIAAVAIRASVGTGALPPLPAEVSAPIGFLVVPLWLAVLAARGAYAGLRRKPPADVLRDVISGVAVALALALVLLFLARVPVNRTLLVGFALASVPVVATGRLLQTWTLQRLRRRAFDPHRIVVIGPDVPALRTVIERHPEWGLHLQAWLTSPTGLAQLLAATPADEVLATSGLDPQALSEVAHVCDELGLPLSLDATFLGVHVTRAELTDLDGWTAVTFRPGSDREPERLAKRALDVSLALAGLILAAPLLAAAAIGIRLADGGPAFFVQRRVGRFGRPFRMVKLRTMVVDAERRLPEVLSRNEVDGPAFKLGADPRVTPIGRWLRRSSVDELPQLWNVLRGEMSLVGPRPPLQDEVARYERWQLRRLSVRPGMTGLWQVSGRADLPFERWVELDLEYVDRWSLWLDLTVLARTLPAVVAGRGAR